MIVHQRWAIAILRVKSIDVRGEQSVVCFHQPESHLEFAHPWPQPVIGEEKGNSSFCLTNALELLDQPGEWFQEYPSGTIYYYPRSGEDMETAEVIIPVLETLMIADGTLERPIRHIHLEGITFAHTSWMRPSYQGHVTLQGGFPLLDAYKLHEPGLPEKRNWKSGMDYPSRNSNTCQGSRVFYVQSLYVSTSGVYRTGL